MIFSSTTSEYVLISINKNIKSKIKYTILENVERQREKSEVIIRR